jgi:BirA family biotin operon repressor/biotin-[acetyl-CoA-carboxylase] ligase
METLFVGKNLIFLPETNSTNSYAIDLLKNVNPPEGTIVHSARQLKGKGQRGAAWTTEPVSNLTVSILLRPSFLKLSEQFFLYIISALAVHDTTAQFLGPGQFDINIKWPNDILVKRRKISGILIENKLMGESITWSVIGIGMNVNQVEFGGLNATSLKLESESDHPVQRVLELLCSQVEKYYLMLKAGKLMELKALYLDHLFGLNETLKFEFAGRQEMLKVTGIGETGLLQLETMDKKFVEVDLKELKWML